MQSYEPYRATCLPCRQVRDRGGGRRLGSSATFEISYDSANPYYRFNESAAVNRERPGCCSQVEEHRFTRFELGQVGLAEAWPRRGLPSRSSRASWPAFALRAPPRQPSLRFAS